MKFTGKALWMIAVVANLVFPTSSPPAKAIYQTQDPFARLDAYVQERMAAAPVPGGGYAIVENGQVVHVAAFGKASLSEDRPLTVHTPMMIGSVGKTITALAIQQLANAGKIERSAPVTRYLPWFSLATPGAAEEISVQNLLDHKSGLSQMDGQDLPRVYRPGLTPEDVVRSLKDIKVIHPAGSVYEYSNLNFILLGVVIEAVSGQTYASYIQDYIFNPLEMRHSTVDDAAAWADGLTQGYRYLFGILSAYDEPFASGVVPAGYHITSIEDMAHYLAALSNGGEYNGISLLTPDGSLPKTRPILNIHWEPTHQFRPGDSTGHSGANLNANAAIAYLPLERTGAVVMVNANPQQFMNLAESAISLANDLLRLYQGNAVLLPRLPANRTVYNYINGALLGLALVVAWHILRLRTWRSRYLNARSRPVFLAGTLLADGVMPVMILLGLPLLMVLTKSAPFLAGWPVLLRLLPDIGYTLLVLALGLLVTGGFKLSWLVSLRSSPENMRGKFEIRDTAG